MEVSTLQSLDEMWTLRSFYQEAGTAVVAMEAILTPELQEVLLVDHIAFKCGSRKSFEHVRGLFEAAGASFWNASISGRSIAYLLLPRPINTSIGEIRFLELSDQKLDGSQTEGFDHIEVYPHPEFFYAQANIVKMLGELGCGEAALSARSHHPTHDLVIDEAGLELRLEEGPLVDTIVGEMEAKTR